MPSVGIIGAGVAGLVAAKTLLEEGFDVTVLEKECEVGGVWAKTRRYPGLTTQNPRDTYAFSDFPMPGHYYEWPTGEQVQEYLSAYADRFDVKRRVELDTRVTAVERRDGAGFTIRSQRLDEPEISRGFDFVVVSSGVYSSPFIPAKPNRDEFEAAGGVVLHSTKFHDTSLIRDKRVVIVGYGKSATDVANAAVGHAKEITLLHRQLRWKAPRFLFGKINMKYPVMNRAAEIFFSYPKAEGFQRALHTWGKTFVQKYWEGVEWGIDQSLGMSTAGLRPEHSFERVGCDLGLAPEGFFEAVQKGLIRPMQGDISRFFAGGVELSSGQRVDADVVLFGTGFRQEISFVEPSIRKILIGEDGYFRLYRGLMHPDLPGLGFVGFLDCLYCPLAFEIGARWVARQFMGELRLPPRDEILERIEHRLAERKRERPFGPSSGLCATPHNFHYIDDLLRDMGARTQRLPGNPIREYLMPVDPSLYADLRAELDRNRRAVAGV